MKRCVQPGPAVCRNRLAKLCATEQDSISSISADPWYTKTHNAVEAEVCIPFGQLPRSLVRFKPIRVVERAHDTFRQPVRILSTELVRPVIESEEEVHEIRGHP